MSQEFAALSIGRICCGKVRGIDERSCGAETDAQYVNENMTI